MQLVSSSGEIVDFCTSDSKYTGGTSEIYEVDESTLLKIHDLTKFGISTSPLRKNDFDILKTIKHKNFINLIERYNRVPQTTENVEAYTYESIKGDTYNPLYLMTDFMIDQFRNIQNLYEIFTSEGIVVADVHVKNSVVLNNRIVIIDPDFYRFITDRKTVQTINKNWFIKFMSTCFGSFDNEKLFNEIEKESDPVKSLEKRLKGCKYPIDYFHK